MKPSRWVVDLPERTKLFSDNSVSGHALRRETRFIVIHAIGEYIDTGKPGEGSQYCVDFLRARNELPHYFLTPSGIVLRAWHHSRLANHARGYNSSSIGIELMLPGHWTYETFAQELTAPVPEHRLEDVPRRLDSLYKLIGELLALYPQARIVGHCELDPTRKVDPGQYVMLSSLRTKFKQPRWEGEGGK